MDQEAIIKVEGLKAKFGNHWVLQDVSFSVFQNQITVILGSSGGGKTTVLKHLIGLYPVEYGKVEVLGKNLATLDENERLALALKFGVLFQNGALLNSLTIGENVAIPLEQHTNFNQQLIEELVDLKLNLVGLYPFKYYYPSELSGGMRKRAALARAIALDPPLLFCDEPSAGLDPITMANLDELILNLKNLLGITIVLVTHEVPSIFRLADRIVFLHEGKALFEGSLSDALQSGIPEIETFFSKAQVKI